MVGELFIKVVVAFPKIVLLELQCGGSGELIDAAGQTHAKGWGDE